jgi:hypothetical protein
MNFLRCLAGKKSWWQLASRCCWNRACHLTCFLSASVTRKDSQFSTWIDPSFQRHYWFRPTTSEVGWAKVLSAPPHIGWSGLNVHRIPLHLVIMLIDSALLSLITCFLGIGVTCQLIMTCADVASWRYPFFSGCTVQLHIVRLRHWPKWQTLQMCHVKEHLDWPSMNRVPNLLRYFMFCIFFACMGLWLLASWDCGFISHRGHVCLSVVSVVCCQVEVSATGRSLVQSCPTEHGVSECDREATIMRRPWPTGYSCAVGGYSLFA